MMDRVCKCLCKYKMKLNLKKTTNKFNYLRQYPLGKRVTLFSVKLILFFLVTPKPEGKSTKWKFRLWILEMKIK